MSNQKITIGISIISHNDEIDVIKNHGAYKNNYEDISFKVAITNNLQKESLREFCSNRNYNHIVNKNKKGFGENNNQNINLLLDQDLIFLVNPEVYFDLDEFVKHIRNIYNQPWDICGANVIEENRLRKPPTADFFPRSWIH